jgi:hypothetical protein
MKKLLFALGVALWLCAPAHAQVASAYTVSACGAQSNPAGQPFPLTMDLKGNLCGSISSTSAAPLYVRMAVGAGVDGWNLTEGATGDAAYAGSGSASIVAILKGIYSGITSPIPAATPPYSIIGGVINGANTYNAIAASQTAQALTGGSGGATGDYLSHCTIVPATTAPGVVTILDNSTAIYSFPGGGTTALTTLIPFSIPIAAVSKTGAWKITTGANVSVVCVGKFT